MAELEFVLATHNQGKIREFRSLFSKINVSFKTLSDFDIQDEPEEVENTFEGNALLKAREGAKRTGKLCLADDSGLVIPALDGAPGIFSKRWAEKDGVSDFRFAFDKIQSELKNRGIIDTNVKAYFVCALAVAWPHGHAETFEGECHGHLTFPPRGGKSFGYDPIFIKEGESRTFAEMEYAEKEVLSHRFEAWKKFISRFVA